MKFVLALLALLITGCAEAHPRDYALRLEFERGGVCSGTAVGKRLVITASHCWQAGRLVKINGQPAYAMKIKHDGADHALVRVTVEFTRWARMGKEPVQGDRVRWIGQPDGMQGIYREGYFAGWNDGVMLFDATAWRGDSGSGLMDDSGRIVAVLYGMYRRQIPSGHDFQIAVAFPLAFTREDWEAVA